MTTWITSEFLTTSSQLQKQKTMNFSTQIQNYFLTFSWAVVTVVVPKLSHFNYLNLPVTVENKLLATKTITYLPQLHWSSNITAFWLPMALENKQAALRIPPKRAKFWNYVWKRVINAIVTPSQQLFVRKTRVFAGIFSYFGA